MMIGFFLLAVGLFLSLAIMDFVTMHSGSNNFPDWMYRYWMALGLVVVVVASLATWMAYAAGLPEKKVPAVFATIIMLFVAGLLDLFYYVLNTIEGLPYSFAIWSVQYKFFVDNLHWLSDWTWTDQIIWSTICFAVIAFIWYRVRDPPYR
jgi:hypothetical protein